MPGPTSLRPGGPSLRPGSSGLKPAAQAQPATVAEAEQWSLAPAEQQRAKPKPYVRPADRQPPNAGSSSPFPAGTWGSADMPWSEPPVFAFFFCKST